MSISIDQIIAFLGVIGVGTIIGSLFNFIQVSKKNHLNFVTKERSEWRNNLKEILLDLAQESKRELAIARLRLYLNPYGKGLDFKATKPYFMKDGHIWDLLEQEVIDFERLALFLELLLKYDWERSKKEVGFEPRQWKKWVIYVLQIGISIIILIILTLNLIASPTDERLCINLITSILVLVLSVLQKPVIEMEEKNPSKNDSKQIWMFMVFNAFPYAYSIWNLGRLSGLLENYAFYTLAVTGLILYELYYLSLFDSSDNEYVREIERHITSKGHREHVVVNLSNRIQKLENKVYTSHYDDVALASIQKSYKKLQRKLTKKNRPRDYLFHPIQYCRYLKERNRKCRLVKSILKH